VLFIHASVFSFILNVVQCNQIVKEFLPLALQYLQQFLVSIKQLFDCPLTDTESLEAFVC
jgi:hypothetical protein